MLKNLSIKWKLILGFGVMLCLTLFVGLGGLAQMSSLVSHYESSRNIEFKILENAKETMICMLQVRRAEKDYLIRGDNKYVERIKENLKKMKERAKESIPLVVDPKFKGSFNEIITLADKYFEAFSVVLQLKKERGNKDKGLYGDFRKASHDIESELAKTGEKGLTVDLLMLRRHEKDYMLRGVDKYIKKLDKRVKTFKTNLAASSLSNSTKSKLNSLVEAYQKKFHALVQGDKKINKTIDEFRSLIHRADPLLETIEKYAENEMEKGDKDIAATIREIRFVTIGLILLSFIAGSFLAYAIGRNILSAVSKVVHMLKDIAQGEADLTQRLEVSSKDEIGQLAHWFNTFVDSLHNTIEKVAQTTEQVASASTELAATSEEMSTGADSLASQASTLDSSTNEVIQTISEVAKNSSIAAKASRATNDKAISGKEVIEKSSGAINTLNENSQRIGEMIHLIADIANKTDLLAINAAIEAANAGEQGKGFAVVAEEVRKLAERTTKATGEITEIIDTIQGNTQEGIRSMKEAGNSIMAITKDADIVNQMIEQIAAATEEQTVVLSNFKETISIITSSTSEFASGTTQTAIASEELGSLSTNLNQAVGRFSL